MRGAIQLDPDRLSNEAIRLKEHYKKWYVNQERAVNALVSAWSFYKSKFWKGGEPIKVLTLLGPTGVGKTYLAKLFAMYLFESPKALTKIDCGSFAERHQLSKLIGAPPGYLGYNHPSDPNYFNPPLLSQVKIDSYDFDYQRKKISRSDKYVRAMELEIDSMKLILERSEGDAANKISEDIARKQKQLFGYLWNKIEKPLKSVILFDEIEKAHPVLYDFLLSIMDDGETTLENGEKVNMENSVIIMTSNAGSEEIVKSIKGVKKIGYISREADENIEEAIYHSAMRKLKEIFRPEFLGRIEDGIVVCKPLSREQLAGIQSIFLRDLYDDIISKFPIVILISDKAKEFLLDRAADHPEFGARQIEDKIKKYMRMKIGNLESTGQIKVGDTLYIDVEGEGEKKRLVFSKDDGGVKEVDLCDKIRDKLK